MKTVRTLLLGLTLCISAAANAQFTFKTVEDAVELLPSNIILPATAGGMMSFRPCDAQCDKPYVRVRLAAETTFSIDGKRMKFDDFRRSFSAARISSTSYALINYNVETRTATNIEVLTSE